MNTDPALATIALRALSSYGLVESAFAYPREPFEDVRWRELANLISGQRTWGIAARAMADGVWPATDAQYEEAAELEGQAAAGMLRLDRLTLQVGDHFNRSGIVWRLLKGPAHAHRLWAQPALRPYSDIDLLVPGTQFDTSGDVIERELSGRRQNPEPYPGMIARVGKSAAFSLPSGAEIDLHRTLSGGPFGAAIDTDRLFDRPASVRLGTTDVPVMPTTALFLHACLHAVVAADPRRLVPLRDVAEGIARLSDDDDLSDLLELAHDCRAVSVIAAATIKAAETFGLRASSPLTRWARSYSPTTRERRWTRCSAGADDDLPLLILSTGLAFRSWSDRAFFARGVLFHQDHDPAWRRAQRIVGQTVRSARPRPP